jgi:hypothetical protein
MKDRSVQGCGLRHRLAPPRFFDPQVPDFRLDPWTDDRVCWLIMNETQGMETMRPLPLCP